MMVGGGRTPPFAASLGPDWMRTRGRAPSSSVEGCSHPSHGMRASGPDAVRQLTKVGRGLRERGRAPQLVLSGTDD
eukprot:scaffold100019_cov80-Phaeocystis_antarctica.AAC.8